MISFPPPRKLRNSPDTTKRSSKLWHLSIKIQVSSIILHHTCVAGFFVDHGDTSMDEESIDRLWLVVRSLKNPDGKFDYKINKFDTIKLGRVRFRVKDFRCEQMSMTQKELYQ